MTGWGAQDDFQAQIEQTVNDRRAVLASMMQGPGRAVCEDCEKPIPELRRVAYPSCTRCVGCQSEHEGSGYTFRRR